MKISKVNGIGDVKTHFEDTEMLVVQAENEDDVAVLNNLIPLLRKRCYRTEEIDKKKYCEECEDDFYNNKNDLGVKECWHLQDSELVLRKKVALNQTPPWNMKPIKVLSCFRQRGFLFIDKNVTK